MSKKLFIVIFIYILLLLALMTAGLLGSRSIEDLNYARKYFSISDIETGRSYFEYGVIPLTIHKIAALFFLLLFFLKGERISKKIDERFKNDFVKIFLTFTSILLMLTILQFPFSLFTGYYRNKIFGLMTADLATWIIRQVSASMLYALISSLALSLMVLIIKRAKRYVVYIPLSLFALSIAGAIIYPRFITPLYYEPSALEDKDLKNKIITLLSDAHITFSDIYVLDKSKYSLKVNAYMTGTGADRRIYLYDTLTKNFNDDEILSVIGHELCHYVEEHMLLGISLGVLGLFLALPFLNKFSILILNRDFKSLSRPDGLAALLILISLFSFISAPVQNSMSRIIENRADEYSLKLTKKPQADIDVTTKMAKMNRTDLLPNPVYSWFYHSHPITLDRIRTAENYVNSIR